MPYYDNVNIQIKHRTIGGSDTPPKKEKKEKKEKGPANKSSEIPINESDVSGLDYITEG